MTEKNTPPLHEKFNTEVFEKDEVVAEKDNVGRKLTPKEYLILYEPEIAPTGHIGVQRDLPLNPERRVEDSPIDLHGHDFTIEESDHGFLVQTRIDNEPSEKGLEGGRISRLTLVEGERKPENVKAHFDDGEWKKLPSTFLERQLVMEARERHNGICRDDIYRASDDDRDRNIDL